MGILFATLLGAAGLGLWLARRFADPILKLTESAKTIAAGRFDDRVTVTTRDEIGALAEAFKLMAGTLQTEKHELVLNAVGEGIHVLDLGGWIIFENPAAEEMLGWEPSELIDKPAHATMHHSKAGGAPYPQSERPIDFSRTLTAHTPLRLH